MTNTVTLPLFLAPTTQELNDIAVERMLEQAKLLTRDPEWNKWRVYEVVKQTIADFSLPADEYERAIKLLTEALNI